MKIGADDYIMKGNLKRLVPAVQRELRDAQSRRERRTAGRAPAIPWPTAIRSRSCPIGRSCRIACSRRS